MLEDASRPHWSDASASRPLAARIWPPREPDQPAAVVLLSHGTGGAAEDLDWLAGPLNEAGFLVAAVDHHGNSYNDDYLVEGFTFMWERPRDVSVLLDHLIASYNVDTARIGAAGFSIGGYTTAALLGARLDPRIWNAVFQGRVPAPEVPEFPNLVETLRASYSESGLAAKLADGAQSVCDHRISAGFVIAPAIGRMLDPDSLAAITAPFQIRWGNADDIAPPDENALIYLGSIPRAAGESLGDEVGHYEFLGDREDPHGARQRVTADALKFFVSTL